MRHLGAANSRSPLAVNHRPTTCSRGWQPKVARDPAPTCLPPRLCASTRGGGTDSAGVPAVAHPLEFGTLVPQISPLAPCREPSPYYVLARLATEGCTRSRADMFAPPSMREYSRRRCRKYSRSPLGVRNRPTVLFAALHEFPPTFLHHPHGRQIAPGRMCGIMHSGARIGHAPIPGVRPGS